MVSDAQADARVDVLLRHGGHINFSRAGKGVGKASPIVLFARLSDGFQSALKATLILPLS